MQKQHYFFVIVLTLITLPMLGFLLTYGLSIVFPLSEQGPILQSVYYLFLIFVMLGAAYMVVKMVLQAAHIADSSEPEVHFSDIPKDKEQLLASKK